jgi:hypothetical protein
MTPKDEVRSPATVDSLFVYVSVSRLVLCSMVSFGLYEAYWIYKNWWWIKKRNNLDFMPFWRGVFCIFFCHSLIEAIRNDPVVSTVQEAPFHGSGLATTWVVLRVSANILGRLQMGISIVSLLVPSYLCLVPVQRYINNVTQKQSPDKAYDAWSFGQMLCVGAGAAIWLLILVGLVG